MFKCSESSFSKTSIPSLEGIMIKAEGNTVTLTGYDLEVGMITSADAEVKENGSIILNAKNSLRHFEKPSRTEFLLKPTRDFHVK